MDRLTKEQRTKNMRAVKNKDSDIEILFRRALYANGLRYRKNYLPITGKPDIVFIRKKIAIFCDSEFWHGYDWQNRKEQIQSNREFWISKIERNIQRDLEVTRDLENTGWLVLRFWGNEIKKNTDFCVQKVLNAIRTR